MTKMMGRGSWWRLWAVVLGVVVWVPWPVEAGTNTTTYSKLVAIKISGASNADAFQQNDNSTVTVKFDTTLNYFNTNDVFKHTLNVASLPAGAKVYMKAVLLQGSDKPEVFHFVYAGDTALKIMTLQEDEAPLLEVGDQSSGPQILDLLSFPVDDDVFHAHAIMLQAEAVDANNAVIGMDAKLVFFNWLDDKS